MLEIVIDVGRLRCLGCTLMLKVQCMFEWVLCTLMVQYKSRLMAGCTFGLKARYRSKWTFRLVRYMIELMSVLMVGCKW